MSTPVVTDRWAGNFDCNVCGRKRLMSSEFSKKAIERHRKTGGPLKCKQCAAKTEEDERNAAAAKSCSSAVVDNNKSDENRKCKTCAKTLSSEAFNRNQWNKGEGKARCRLCVEQSLADDATAQKQSNAEAFEKARQEVKRAKASGNAHEILKAESVLSALEAEQVTGLKPVRMGRGGGRCRGARRGGIR